VSTQTSDRAQVIPLRPATAAVAPVRPAATDRVTAVHEGATVPGAGHGRTGVDGQRPGLAQPGVPPSRVLEREPLWRHVVGDVLRRERRGQGLRLKDVADAARISMPYLSEVERGRKEASSEVLAAAAHALGLALADLLALAQADLARFAATRRPRTADPAHPAQQPPLRPDQDPDAGQPTPAGESTPASDDNVAAPASQATPDQAEAWLTPPVDPLHPANPQPEPVSSPQPGQAVGPLQVRMSLAA
jgi:transcriptional regulator with XRE-family HTH domain